MNTLILLWLLVALVIFPLLLRITAPYGRHTKAGWGITLPNHIGWIIMESPAWIVMTTWFFINPADKSNVQWFFYLLYMGHYIYRSLIFPFRLRTKGKDMPLVIVLSAILFNLVNASILGYFVSYACTYTDVWFYDPRFILGLALFILGFGINFWADSTLINLRKPGETGYKIPQGGLFNYISCPNHFGEILEWCGYALLCWSVPALSFAIWTAANLLPRALSHHRWYRDKFPEYPARRKAVIPFLW
jgi:hypothetical protein